MAQNVFRFAKIWRLCYSFSVSISLFFSASISAIDYWHTDSNLSRPNIAYSFPQIISDCVWTVYMYVDVSVNGDLNTSENFCSPLDTLDNTAIMLHKHSYV